MDEVLCSAGLYVFLFLAKILTLIRGILSWSV